MPVGSTWSKSRSASCAASVWIVVSMTQSGSSAKLPLGSGSETKHAPASGGCSQPTRHATKCAPPIQARSKSHNHCAEPLVAVGESKFAAFDPGQRAKKLSDLRSIKRIPSYWTQFVRLEHLIAHSPFPSPIIDHF